MATSITYGSTTAGGKSLSKSIADVNPNVSNSVIKEFTSRLNALTTNTLESVNRVDKTAIDTHINYYDITATASWENDNGKGTVNGNSLAISKADIVDTNDTAEMTTANFSLKIDGKAFYPESIIFNCPEGLAGSSMLYTDGGSGMFCAALLKSDNTKTETITLTVPSGKVTLSNKVYNYNALTVTVVITE